ncbi:hypothetical protein Ancab_013473 [Ancistrocladus abbreviatus]
MTAKKTSVVKKRSYSAEGEGIHSEEEGLQRRRRAPTKKTIAEMELDVVECKAINECHGVVDDYARLGCSCVDDGGCSIDVGGFALDGLLDHFLGLPLDFFG